MPFSVYFEVETMKKTLKISALLLIFVLGISLVFSSCDKIFPTGGDEYSTEELTAPDYADIVLSEYVTLGEYKGLSVSIGGVISEDITDDVLLWEAVLRNAEVKKYPEAALSYYEEQTTRLYMTYADEGKMSYDELMASLGKTSEDIKNEAKKYVKSDLVSLAIIETEGLHLTNDEKARLFDKYVEKFVTTYGYTEEYVRNNLEDEIYDTMQHDKMMEYLLLNNKVIYVTEEE